MIQIIPAILPKSFEELEAGLAHLRGGSRLVQIDLVGENVLAEHEAIPFWEEYDFECDIMLPDPENQVRGCIDIGASRIVVHAEAPKAHEALLMLQATREGEYAVAVGLAFTLKSLDEVGLPTFAGLYDYLQIMGIEHVGSQGQPFDPRVLPVIKQLREQYRELTIQVDGGVAAHVHELAQAGANRLIVGGVIMHSDNPQKEIERLYTEANVGA